MVKNEMYELALNTFKDLMPNTEILSVSEIHDGYTNINFQIETASETYILRIPKNKNPNYKDELKAYEIAGDSHFTKFDTTSGIYIKKKLDGVNANFSDKNQLTKVLDKIEELSQTFGTENIKSASFLDYMKHNTLDEMQTLLFKSLVIKYDDADKVFCHHDINEGNVIFDQNLDKIHFIDYEWARLDDIYFEYASICLNKKVDENWIISKLDLDKTKLLHYKYMHLCMSHMWCNYMNDEKSYALQKEISKDIDKIFSKIL